MSVQESKVVVRETKKYFRFLLYFLCHGVDDNVKYILLFVFLTNIVSFLFFKITKKNTAGVLAMMGPSGT